MVFHPVRPAPWGISLKQQRKTLFDALLYKKHRRLYRERIRRAPPWKYHASVASVLAAALTAAGGLAAPSLASAAVWGVLTGQFCAHRLRDTSRAPVHIAEMVLTSALIPPIAIFWRLRGALSFRVFFI